MSFALLLENWSEIRGRQFGRLLEMAVRRGAAGSDSRVSARLGLTAFRGDAANAALARAMLECERVGRVENGPVSG